MTTNLSISVIIPTYNGAKKIVNILTTLSQQTYNDFETIVVIDGSSDNTEQILAENNFGLKNLKVIVQANGGRSVSRNRGVKEAKGELLIFFDDDMRPIVECVALHLNHQQNFPNSILVGNQLEDLAVLKTDIQRFKAHLSRKWGNELGIEKRLIDKKRPYITAANLSIPKKIFWELEGFDERLTDAEDFDLAVKASLKNLAIYYDPKALAWHDDFITCQSYIKRLKQYQKSHEKLKELKPELYQEFNQYEYNQIGGFKKLIYAFFAQSFWIWTIDKFNWLKILPKKIRYKIYDLVITGSSVYFPKNNI